MNMDFERKLAIPMEVKEMYPLDPALSMQKSRRDDEIRDILTGRDNRLLLIIGPCSADEEESVIDYVLRLKKVSDKVSDRIFIIPRVYTNKPRTLCSGYKGLLHQPEADKKPDMFKGIIATRELHMRVLKETGFTCADELLYPENHKYIDDLLAYVTVGARSVEDQQHRLTSSGIEVPVGMKNPTGGFLKVMMNSVYAAQHPHTFIYRGWEAHSKGNPLAHVILRGYTNRHGEVISNYRYEDLKGVAELYKEMEEEQMPLQNPAVIVDCNHDNSGKNPFLQREIALDVINSRKRDEEIGKLVKGFMIESYIEDGAQEVGEGVYGKSITDPCLGWEKTEELIYALYEAV